MPRKISELKGNAAILIRGASKEIMGEIASSSDELLEIKTSSGNVWNIDVKSICAWREVDSEPQEKKKFPLLFCRNDESGCKGVQFVSKASAATQGDYEKFMGKCQCRSDKCKKGFVPDFRDVTDQIAGAIFSGTLLGEFPENK